MHDLVYEHKNRNQNIIKIIDTNRLGLLINLSRLVARNGRSRRKFEDVQMMCG